MKVGTDLVNQIRIPTIGMEQFDVVTSREVWMPTRLYDEITLTKFYRDCGQLHWSGEESELTCSIYFIQRADGVLEVTPTAPTWNTLPMARNYLDANVSADVIECRVAEVVFRKCVDCDYGPLIFVALCHPDWEVRKALATEILEYEDASQNTSQHA